jgi:hypothetical protein
MSKHLKKEAVRSKSSLTEDEKTATCYGSSNNHTNSLREEFVIRISLKSNFNNKHFSE